MPDLVRVPQKTLFGIQEVVPSSFNDSENAAEASERLWRRFIDAISQAGAPLNVEMYGVSWPADEQTPPQYVHYFCGFEYPCTFEAMTQLTLEGGDYFSFRYEGPATTIDEGFREAYLEALPASGLTSRSGQHLEIYGDEYDPSAEIAVFQILIPVKS